jgi:hypothetical protein
MIGRNLHRMIGSYNGTYDLRPLVKRGTNLAGMVYGTEGYVIVSKLSLYKKMCK